MLDSEIFSSRFVDAVESVRLRVESGWYVTKRSGTFVTGPHATQEVSDQSFAPALKKKIARPA